MNKKSLAVFFGGMSSEHDISCLSAATVVDGLDRSKYDIVLVGITRTGCWLPVRDVSSIRDGSWRQSLASAVLLPDAGERSLLVTEENGTTRKIRVDVAFPVLHGRFGEDGTIQGLFELAKIPYVGCGVAASAVCMDKLYAKALVNELGIAQARHVAFTLKELRNGEAYAQAKVEAAFGYPVFVKPTDGGSSYGVSRVDRREDLFAALLEAASEGTRVMVEEAIVGRELECAVLSTPEGTKASGVGEIRAAAEFYDFEAKYENPASETDTQPVLPEGKEEEIRRDALKIFNAVGGYGMARVDFFLEKDTERVVFNEVNTIPGFTSISMYPMLWRAAGMPLGELLDRLVDSAFYR
ncbi:MAG: D-alanine--D-alanine ligase [Lachnospiraceae bacterium]|nr:D-alanine--D-alanine ligase [Lachnospiraceae bacterium]